MKQYLNRAAASAAIIAASVLASQAQAPDLGLFPAYTRPAIYDAPAGVPLTADDLADMDAVEALDAYFDGEDMTPDAIEAAFPALDGAYALPAQYLRPAVFDRYHLLDSLPLNPAAGGSVMLNGDAFNADLIRQARQQYIVSHPELVRYNEAHLPEPPRKFTATIDPATAKIVIAEVMPPVALDDLDKLEAPIEKRHWLKTFNANLQFSQAYVSPNWYQGGTNNVNALANVYYNVKLNPAFHTSLLFESTFQYKLGMTNAPEDELRGYSISEDLLQINSTLGWKMAKRWYYSMNLSFKTQFLNNYTTNTNDLKASFMSPSELNVGVGLTYNYVNPANTLTFDASISPLSWNMKTCLNSRVDETTVGLNAGQRVKNEIGSSAEGKLSWQICSSVAFRSRLFVFTDYTYIQSDWENTLMFTINKFLTTQIFCHMRYDSSTPRIEGTDWHKLQLKEILSFGFTYQFSSI